MQNLCYPNTTLKLIYKRGTMEKDKSYINCTTLTANYTRGIIQQERYAHVLPKEIIPIKLFHDKA